MRAKEHRNICDYQQDKRLSTPEGDRELLPVYNPGLGFLQGKGVDFVRENHHLFDGPFLYLLSAKLYSAVDSSEGIACCVDDDNLDKVRGWMFVHDHFLPQAVKAFERKGLKLPRFIIESDTVGEVDPPHFNMVSNIFCAKRSGSTQARDLFDWSHTDSSGNCNFAILPFGCPSAWIPAAGTPSKTVFFDEPHITLLESLESSDDLRVRLLKHALATAKVLHSRGFKIVTFFREHLKDSIRAEYEFMEILSEGVWLSHKKLMAMFAENSLFYSFFPETRGFPIYENLMIGNGVIGYSEAIDAYVVRPMETGVLLSLRMTPELASDTIECYFEEFRAHDLRFAISEEAHRKFSTDRYFQKLAELRIFDV